MSAIEPTRQPVTAPLQQTSMTRLSKIAALVALIAVAGCSAPDGSGVYDPLEPVNRVSHGANKALDTVALRPASQVYGNVVPKPIRQGVNNFASNLSLPGMVLNDLLQLNIEDALQNTGRFMFNSTFGLAGVLDPATPLGIEAKPTDFGETLYVWGVGEGPYVEMPVLGPSNARDAVGQIVDIVINPAQQILPTGQQWVVPATTVATRVDDRFTFGATVDSVLYDSEDSYAQSRLFFLENRRFSLGDEISAEDDLYDLYEEAFE